MRQRYCYSQPSFKLNRKQPADTSKGVDRPAKKYFG